MKENELNTNMDEDFEDEAWFSIFREAMDRDEGNIYVPIPSEVEKVRRVYQAMKELTADQYVEVTYSMFESFLFCGDVTLEGLSMEFRDLSLFADAALCADNFEIYPLVNGKVRMSFAFNHLATKVGRIDKEK